MTRLSLPRVFAVAAAAMTFGAVALAPANAAAPAPAPRSGAAVRTSPGPDCADNGNTNPCWEYQTWFWTFDNCNTYYSGHPYDPSRYDNHVCAVFTNGATVGLWYHKYRG
jgi:hypothetical protein